MIPLERLTWLGSPTIDRSQPATHARRKSSLKTSLAEDEDDGLVDDFDDFEEGANIQGDEDFGDSDQGDDDLEEEKSMSDQNHAPYIPQTEIPQFVSGTTTRFSCSMYLH